MVVAVVNRPSSKPHRAIYKVLDTSMLLASAYLYEINMTEDEIDRRILAQAAEENAGKDWRAISKPLR
ncbi:MAG: hypothetical protein ACRD1T_26280 [Acidimicrobiia bacterium]